MILKGNSKNNHFKNDLFWSQWNEYLIDQTVTFQGVDLGFIGLDYCLNLY